MKKIIYLVFFMAIFSQSAIGGVCDYTPSNLIGGKASGAIGVGAGATAATGFGMQAAGVYTMTNATTGAVMLGSTTGGASIIAGTSGVLGSIGAAIMSPFVIIPAAVVAVGVGAYEGGCLLAK